MADKALLAGINDYKFVSDLQGCENDVRSVEQLLTGEFGFPPSNVQKLFSHEVTKERIKQGWNWMLSGAAPGDRLVFHFSGHGSYTTDLDGDEPDGVDELICLVDMDWDDPQTYLLDDELRAFTQRVPPGVLLTVILDSCHSGTGTRMLMAPAGMRGMAADTRPEKRPMVDVGISLARLGEQEGTRGLSLAAEQVSGTVARLLDPRGDARAAVLARYVEPPPKVIETLNQRGVRSSFHAAAVRDAKMNHVLLAGSEATQTSADAYIAGTYHGAFTYYLCQTSRDGGASLDQQDLIRRLRATLSHNHFSQVPQLEPADARGPLFRPAINGGSAAPPPAPAPAGAPSPAHVPSPTPGGIDDVLAQVIHLLEELLRRKQAEGRASSVPPSGSIPQSPVGLTSHAAYPTSFEARGAFGDAVTSLQQALTTFAQKLGTKLGQFVDDVTTLEVSTYACEKMQPGAQDAPPELRARTTIKPDGDTDVYVPREAGQIDERLWTIHVESVKQAQQYRAEMLTAAVSAASGLMNVFKP